LRFDGGRQFPHANAAKDGHKPVEMQSGRKPKQAGKTGWSDGATRKWHGGQADQYQTERVKNKQDPAK